MEDMFPHHDAFRCIVGAMLDEAVFIGRNEAEPELYEDNVTEKMTEEIMECLKPYTDKDVPGEALVDMLEARTKDERRLAICGLFFDSVVWDWMDAKRAAAEIYNMVRWLYESYIPLQRMPKLFLANFSRTAMRARYKVRAEAGDEAARWIIQCDEGAGAGPMCACARAMLNKKIMEFSRRNSIAAPSFDKDKFRIAVEHHIGLGNGYAKQLMEIFAKMPDDMVRANVGTALLEMYGVNLLESGKDIETYMSGVEAILHFFKGLDVFGALSPEAMTLVAEL